jgi:queuine tRNA-ribosyltransferase subunit QTRTD1
MLDVDQYVEAVQSLAPDIVVCLADIPPDPGVKRREKMVDRTWPWTLRMIKKLGQRETRGERYPAVLAPILPIDNHQQAMYLEDLLEHKESVHGLALYSPSSISAIPTLYENHPLFLFASPSDPHALLSYISLGIDIFTIPFINECSDGGIALTFSFPDSPPHESMLSSPLPLGMDMWFLQYATEGLPLVQSCECLACLKHHRSYVNHLLNSKEMLGWTLLQLHNIHTMEKFFKSVRLSIENGTFEADVDKFARRYEKALPKSTGNLPTRRGYQSASERGSKKKPKSYNKFNDTSSNAGAGVEINGNARRPSQDYSPTEPIMFPMSDPKKHIDRPDSENKRGWTR